MVSWERLRFDGLGYFPDRRAIRARRLDAAGVPLGPDSFAVDPGSLNASPEVLTRDAGFIVTWRQTNLHGVDTLLPPSFHARFLNGDASYDGDAVTLIPPPPGEEDNGIQVTNATATDAGGLLLTYDQFDYFARETNALVRAYDPTGAADGPANRCGGSIPH